MSKIGRNDPCPCGSGKKYKRCCLERDQKLELLMAKGLPDLQTSNKQPIHDFISYEEVDELSTEEIIEKLQKMKIPIQKEEFIKKTKEYYSAQDLSEDWFKKYPVLYEGREEDFPFMAAYVLWDRLGDPNYLSRERLASMYRQGLDKIDEGKYIPAIDLWLQIWDVFKRRHRKEDRTLDFLDEKYSADFFVGNFVQDVEFHFYEAGRKDKNYFKKQITYCKEFCELFPEDSELILVNMRRAIGFAYFYLGQVDQAKREFKQLTEDYPYNVWGYISLGDLYREEGLKNLPKAKLIYEKGLAVAKNKGDKMDVLDRMRDVTNEIGKLKIKEE